MASHSRRSTSRMPRITATRAAFTLALASATSVPFLAGTSAQAQPGLTPAEVRAKVAELYREAEQATQQYDGAKQAADRASTAVDHVQDELARKTARLNAARDALGSVAAEQYRTGSLDPTLQLALGSSPETYLEQAGRLNQLGARQAAALSRLAAQQRDIAQTRSEAGDGLDALRSAQSTLASRKRAVERKLAQARTLLARLTPAARASVAAGSDSVSPEASRATAPVPLTAVTAVPSPRAAQAVAFAYRTLGLPYVWGATGPHAYDCSGLTQAAWKHAGVSLPRTTYTQINAGTRVSASELRPGDLVFFYSGISHVGLYIGNGRMIHAPHPGAPVRIAPISQMPFAGATRPV